MSRPNPDTAWARRPAARALRRVFLGAVLGPVRRLLVPTNVIATGDSVPVPLVVVANHTSHVDTMVLLTRLPRAVRRRVMVAAAADYFFRTPAQARRNMLLLGAFPVDRSRVSRATLNECHHLLTSGWSVIIYPEGGRSTDGELQAFKPGAAWIAKRAGVAVLPVHIDGAYRILPKGATRPRRGHVTLRIGEPLSAGADEDARDFNRRVEAAVRALAPVQHADQTD